MALIAVPGRWALADSVAVFWAGKKLERDKVNKTARRLFCIRKLLDYSDLIGTVIVLRATDCLSQPNRTGQ
jgi:hypothetical protein